MGEIESTIKKALPIMVYGNSILRRACMDIREINLSVDKLIADLWNTLELAGGVGLAAPQINFPLNAFVVKSTLMYNDLNTEYKQKLFCGDKGIEEVFINAKILACSEDMDSQPEGCLSIPGIDMDVERPWGVIVEYLDKDFIFHRKEFSGYTARVIQHEFDHTQGILFIDHLPLITQNLIKEKLQKIKKGLIQANYPIHYSNS